MKYCCLLLLIFCFLTKVSGQFNLPWQYSSPEKQGMNSLTLINGIKNFRQKNVNIHSLLIIRNNKVVLDTYFYPFQQGFVHDLASVTKSVTALLIGIAVDKGFIKDDDRPVLNYFPEYTILNDTLGKLKIRHLLNMSSGFRCSWFNGEQELKQMRNNEDWVKFMFSLPFESMPGDGFSYCSGNFYLLAEILQRTTRMTCLDFANKFLFQPLDIEKSFWESNKIGVNHGWGDLFLSPYDMAKIGFLILNDGRWEGKQIISKEWIEKIKPLYKIQGTESYGYGWWLDSENPDEIQAVGRGGQRLFVFKDRNLVIATTGGGFEAGDIDNLVLESINRYDKNKDNSFSLDSLNKMIRLPYHDKRSIKDSLPINILNRSFKVQENDLKIRTVRFELRDKTYFLIIIYADGSAEEHPVGMDGEYVISKGKLFGLPVALKGFWENEKLIVYLNELCRINLLKITFGFSDNTIDINIIDLTDGWTKKLKGRI